MAHDRPFPSMKPSPLNYSAFATLAIASLTSAFAQQVYFEFDQYTPLPSASNTTVFPPYDEDGLRISSNKNIIIPGQLSVNNPGVKTFIPMGAGAAVANYSITSTNGRKFTVKSLRLHPASAGTNVNVSFFAAYGNGNLWSAGASSGAALTGTQVVFDSHFENLTGFSWGASNANTHQISALLIEFQPEVTMTAALTATENSGSATLPVSMTSPLSTNVQIPYSIQSTSATLGTDFNLPAGGSSGPGGTGSGVVTIPAGETRANITIPIVNDTTTESPETFTVLLLNPPANVSFPANATTISSVITIASDDGISNFAGWMSNHALTGNDALPLADPNNDGVSNLESWLLRLNPAGTSPAAWFSRRASFVRAAGNQAAMRLEIPNPLPSDVRIIFEETSTLNPWSEQTRRSGFAVGSLWTGTGASRVVESNTLTSRTITFPSSPTLNAGPKGFMRMKYELISGVSN